MAPFYHRTAADNAGMRSLAARPPAAAPSTVRGDWGTVGRLLPYLWHYRWRVALAPVSYTHLTLPKNREV